jgi:UDP:flavonoid glycosyltransferase YjiC (YdhE family)
MQTWERWREYVEREGMEFAPAPEYNVFPTPEQPLKPYVAAVRAAREMVPVVRELDPDAVVADILTLGAAMAAERAGRPWATLVPHLLPTPAPGLPPYSVGARPPRTDVGARLWSLARPLLSAGERRGRDELNGARERVGLPPLAHLHGGISRQLALVATFPQFEYPRADWHPSIRVTGPLLWEPPSNGSAEPPPGDDPLVLVAPSTSQDPDQRMLRAALEGLAGEPVRVLAATNRRPPPGPVPANARLVDWISYPRVMPDCAAVISHAGHGTLAHAYACGVPMLACPEAGDMAENGARIRWLGVGVSLPRRLVTPRGVRLALRRLLDHPDYTRRARELGDWSTRHDGAGIAADAVEEFAARRADTTA